MKIISFYTDNYLWDSNELIKTLNQSGVTDYEVEHKPTNGNWVMNTQIKAPFILEKLKQNESIVWTDADSRVRQYPSLFDEIKEDCAFFFMPKKNAGSFSLPPNCILKNDTVERQGYLQSGTMYFKNTPKVIEMLELWCQLNEKDRSQWDQWTLQVALNSTKDISVYVLPPEYVWIDTYSQEQFGNKNPVVYHTQASRRFRYSG
jgi:hypothetical protein